MGTQQCTGSNPALKDVDVECSQCTCRGGRVMFLKLSSSNQTIMATPTTDNMVSCSKIDKIAEAEAAVSVNKKKW